MEEASRETERGREDELMANESKPRQSDANIYSIECRTRGKSGDRSGLEGRRSHKAECLIGGKSDWVHVQFAVTQKIQREDECFEIENREGSGGPKFQFL
jgi:hypothetical protein